MATLVCLFRIQLSALHDLDRLQGSVHCALGYILNQFDNFIALKDFAEDDVATVKPWGRNGGDEELRTVGILAGVCHAQKALPSVPKLEVLILELRSVDRLSSSPVTLREITTLNHEVLDNAVEVGAFVAVALIASSQYSEILRCLGNSLSVQSKHNPAQRLTPMLNVEVDLAGNLRTSRLFGLISLYQHESDRKDQKERDKKVSEIHGCLDDAAHFWGDSDEKDRNNLQ